MVLRCTWIWCSLFAAVTLCAAENENPVNSNQNCSSDVKSQFIERVSSDLKRVAECDWSPQQAATLLLTLRNATELLNDRQKECHIEKPPLCPTPEVPENGGLGCVTVGKRYFCKPMCNHGFDFTFLRRSLLFNECSEQTHNRWNTQYIGGNKLAVCQESALQISGRTSAYFPENQDCLMTKSQLKEAFIKGLITELQSLGIQGKPGTACLICG